MRARLIYGAAAGLLLVGVILIGMYMHDAFIRPFGGDILVVILLCCLVRALEPCRIPMLPLWVLLFAFAVEFAQLLGIAALIPEDWTVVRVAVGSVFSVWDLVCYAVGCILFWGAEQGVKRCRIRRKK